ncbi:MAG: hypothetical protein HC821_00400 [Lewinella sp.]|nr:hypothetical protein [Lewinella sp.]
MPTTYQLLALACVIALLGCGPTASTNPENNNTNSFDVQDSSQYDPAFLKALGDLPDSVQLQGDYLVFAGDTSFFPTELPQNQALTFAGEQDGNTFRLSLTRTNLTTLNYTFLLTDTKQQTIDQRSGKALLNPSFFLAAEIDEDPQSGESYGSTEYLDENEKSGCTMAIRLGVNTDAGGKSRARVSYYCADPNAFSLGLEDCPVLRTE